MNAKREERREGKKKNCDGETNGEETEETTFCKRDSAVMAR